MKRTFLLFGLLFTFGSSFAQTKDSLSIEEQERRKRNIEAGNPFKKFGYTPKIATLSKGKYLEWHDLDSIVRIGSFSYHVKKKEITGYNMHEDKNSESTLRPELTSRWMSPDPLAEEFPSWSPYNFTMNNPIRYIDPDGRAPFDIIDIDVNSGNVSVTAAEGNDVVRAVDNGEVVDSYEYGGNGSFNKDVTLRKENFFGFNKNTLTSVNTEKMQGFFEFSAKNAKVEFGLVNASKDGKSETIVTTLGDDSTVDAGNEAKGFMDRGYTVNSVYHSHPDGSQPSGFNSDGTISTYRPKDRTNAGSLQARQPSVTIDFRVYSVPTNSIYIYDSSKSNRIDYK